jgi:uncharacterized protein YfaS (alpha-2-macroglobulin family)
MKIYLSLFVSLLFLLSCKKEVVQKTTAVNQLGKYVVEHIPSAVNVDETLKIRLASIIENKDQIKLEEILKFTPSIEGIYKWTDDRTIGFIPSENLPYNTPFHAELDISKLYASAKGEAPLIIAFGTNDLTLKLQTGGIKYNYNNDEKLVAYGGSIVANEAVKNDAVEKMLDIMTSDKQKLTIDWNHTKDGRTHTFIVENIERTTEENTLKIDWKGGKLAKGFSGQRTTTIPPLGEFVVTEATVIEEGTKYIRIIFSEALSTTQDLKGMISASNFDLDYTYAINGSELKLFPKKIPTELDLSVSDKIKDQKGKFLARTYSKTLRFKAIKPAIRLLGRGVIIPNTDKILFPFEATQLDYVDIEVFKIFESNVLQYLQYNKLDGQSGLAQVGRIIHQEKLDLAQLSAEKENEGWSRYAIDLQNIIQVEPGAIYQIRIGFQQDYTSYVCEQSIEGKVEIYKDGNRSIMRYQRNYDGYAYEHNDDPCYPAYYNASRFVSRNVLASNIGIIAKRDADHTTTVHLTDLKTGKKIKDARVEIYDFQHQKLGEGRASNGSIKIACERTPKTIIVKHQGTYGYLSISDQYANSMTEFDISGKTKKKEVDGYIYGERGVWRPGDTIFLSFILEDKSKLYPTNHPVSIYVKDAKGTQRYTKTTSEHNGRIYVFPIPTNTNDVTGNWKAIVEVGNHKFYKTLKVETIKPNRLKIIVDKKDDAVVSLYKQESRKINVQSNWLHGAPASQLKAKVDLQYVDSRTYFSKFSDFRFTDPSRRLNTSINNIYDKKLNEDGAAIITIPEPDKNSIAGKIKANFKVKVFELGGAFSEDNFSLDVEPFPYYVGVKVPKNRWYSSNINLKSLENFDMIIVDKEGKPAANKKLSIGIYRVSNDWWYSRSRRNIYKYASDTHTNSIITKEVITDKNGRATIEESFDKPGSMLIRVCDTENGHCSGEFFYVNRYYDDDRSTSMSDEQLTQISRLFLKTDKEKYDSKEQVKLTVPSNKEATILLSLEQQGKVIREMWVKGKEKETIINIDLDKSMAPTLYAHVSLIQKHDQVSNDLPMRMYGVVPINVVDPQTKIQPVVEMKDKLEPKEKYTVTVSEKNNRPMSYTLAVVDEGLLDLTRYKTPDPWNHFYSKQSLLVKTWDNYNFVLNGYGKNLENIISVGGDGEAGSDSGPKKANRFKPVVSFLGPFTIGVGEKQKHDLTLPNYLGSVKVMVVARDENSYGNIDKQVPVKKPVMILPSFPRVLAPGEIVELPVTVFAMEKNIKEVAVDLETSDMLTIVGEKTQQVSFDKIGDKLTSFRIQVPDKLGIARLQLSASSGVHSVTQEIEIDIRNPNPFITEVKEQVLEPGQEWKADYALIGVEGTNEVLLEVSSLPSMNLDKRLKYLIKYPYGCLEQTTSSVFPQLYLNDITDYDSKKQSYIDNNIKQGIERLSRFQRTNGGLSYWPGGRYGNDWAETYAGHFLIEAKNKGYYVSSNIMKDYMRYTKERARSFSLSKEKKKFEDRYGKYYKWKHYEQNILLSQAYRLYILALNGSPELAPMNILREEKKLGKYASYLLATAYAISGKQHIAKELLQYGSTTAAESYSYRYSYGSEMRNRSLMAMCLSAIGKKSEAAQEIKEIAKDLGKGKWYSTQSTAFALLAVGKFLGDTERDDIKFKLDIPGGTAQDIQSTNSLFSYKLSDTEMKQKKASFKNTSKDVLFVTVISSGQPAKSDVEAYSKHIDLQVYYTDLDRNTIDPTRLEQGTDFFCNVRIKHLGTRKYNIENLALSQIFPSGWEIQNSRLSSFNTVGKRDRYDYKDVRDDRVYTFFDLSNGETKLFSTMLNASYPGEYILPDFSCEAMYDNEIQTLKKGKKVKVISTNL